MIKQILFPGMYWGAMYIIVVFIFVIYTNVTLKPEYQTRSIKISRIIWIIYALLAIIIWLDGYFSIMGVYSADWEGIFQTFLTLFTLLQLILLFIIQVFIPESLLITDYQILRARKMYKIVKSKPIPVMMGLDRVQDYLRDVFEVIVDG